MNQFHKPGDEKRTPLVLTTAQFDAWLGATPSEAQAMMHWHEMPELVTMSAVAKVTRYEMKRAS
jgi:putative SOS response-associated peptidase YedK